ncbi:hypothetical protein RclHR1_13720003 [Rhizophagus clarus]|uniref:Uncharacterized protein n=1 Tax=Rhizophagus clarus TaxID=94130 RepID=A0A2Z6QCQ1_9GLOM|nr:hypothetical protein RclHR1_13720003 [Rhizophagus clarus]GES78815.1 hypothetical protein GLOIN_2v1669585 [Rhizophagus clarus]
MSNQINDKQFLDNIINSYVHPYIKPPFPPLIDPKDLISKSIVGNKPNRAPNAFIIYRKMYVREARNEGYCFPMTVLSSMVSQSWEKEPEEVKNYYKKLAKEAFDYRNKLYPKPESKRKKRSNWNVISFEKKSNNDKINDVESKKESTFTPSEISVNNQTELDFINQISTPDLSHESSTTTSPIIDDWSIDELNTIDFNPNLTSSNENCSYMNSYEQQSFENFQPEIDTYDHFMNQIIDNQIRYYNVTQNQEMFCINDPQLNYCQVNPNILPSSSPNVLGIFEYHDELSSNLQPFYSNMNTIPENTCVNQQFYIPEPFDYYSFY